MLPHLAFADYHSAYQKVVDDFNRGYNSVNGSSGATNNGTTVDNTTVTPILTLPSLFNKPKAQNETTKTTSEQVEASDNKLAYNVSYSGNGMYQGSVKDSLRYGGGTQLTASAVYATPVNTSARAPYGTLLLVIIMLLVLVFLAWLTMRKKHRINRHYAATNYNNGNEPYPQY